MILIIAPNKNESYNRDGNLLGQTYSDRQIQHLQAFRPDEVFGVGGKDWDRKAVIGKDLLFIQASSWFSKKALVQLQLRISQQKNPLRVLADALSASSDSRVLALYLPASSSESVLKHFLISSAMDMAQISRQVEECDTLEAFTLDGQNPPFSINNIVDLNRVEQVILYERACEAMLKGVRIRDPRQVAIRGELHCGAEVEIDLQVIIEGKVHLGDGVRIGANSLLKNVTLGANSRVNPFSIVEDAWIGANTFVGPYGRVRPGTTIGDSVQIGNFVEIKSSEIGSGSRINHLAFVGDSILAKDVTIGAGCITCNHNGKGVCKTQIGEGAYIGSGSQLVAPVTIGENATIAAGSTITQDAPAEKLTVARSRQVTVEGWSRPKK